METKEIIQALKCCHNSDECEDCEYNELGKFCEELLKRDAAQRLEELEAELGKRTINDRPYEWISVEDVPYPDLDCNVNMSWHLYPQDVPCYLVFQGNGSGDDGVTHWMRVEPPKPKEPTFKDVFLKAFPKAIIFNPAVTVDCCAVFPWLLNEKYCCQMDMTCEECWNQPYFEPEEEGEADADNSK